jgi:hypothetical protein
VTDAELITSIKARYDRAAANFEDLPEFLNLPANLSIGDAMQLVERIANLETIRDNWREVEDKYERAKNPPPPPRNTPSHARRSKPPMPEGYYDPFLDILVLLTTLFMVAFAVHILGR